MKAMKILSLFCVLTLLFNHMFFSLFMASMQRDFLLFMSAAVSIMDPRHLQLFQSLQYGHSLHFLNYLHRPHSLQLTH